MKIRKAIEALKKGKEIRRKAWTCNRVMDKATDNMIWDGIQSPNYSCRREWIPTIQDLLANDWEVLK